jgi:hypothetical protein
MGFMCHFGFEFHFVLAELRRGQLTKLCTEHSACWPTERPTYGFCDQWGRDPADGL